MTLLELLDFVSLVHHVYRRELVGPLLRRILNFLAFLLNILDYLIEFPNGKRLLEYFH